MADRSSATHAINDEMTSAAGAAAATRPSNEILLRQRKLAARRLKHIRDAMAMADSERDDLLRLSAELLHAPPPPPPASKRRHAVAGEVLDAFVGAALAAKQPPPPRLAEALLAASVALPRCSPALAVGGRAPLPSPAPPPSASDTSLKPTTPASAIRDGQTTTARFRLKQPARLAIPETPAEGRSLNVLASAPPMATLAEGLRLEPYELRELPLSAKSCLSIESYSSC